MIESQHPTSRIPHQAAWAALHTAFQSGIPEERAHAKKAAVALLRVCPSFQPPLLHPLLTDRNHRARLTALEVVRGVGLPNEELFERISPNLDDPSPEIRSAAVATMEITQRDVALKETAIARLRGLLDRERSPDVGIQICRTLWSLGDQSDADGFRDYYLRYLTQRALNERNLASLRGLRELGGKVVIPFDQVLSAVEFCEGRLPSIAEGRNSPYYQELLKFLSDQEVRWRKHDGVRPSRAAVLNKKTIARWLASPYSLSNLLAFSEIGSQPNRHQEGLPEEWIHRLIELTGERGAWFPLLGRARRLGAVRLLAFAYNHPVEAMKTLVPLTGAQDRWLSQLATKSLHDLLLHAAGRAADTVPVSIEFIIHLHQSEDLPLPLKYDLIQRGYWLLHLAGPDSLQKAPKKRVDEVLSLAESVWVPYVIDNDKAGIPALEPAFHLLAGQGRTESLLTFAGLVLAAHPSLGTGTVFPFMGALGVHGQQFLPNLEAAFNAAAPYSPEKMEAAACLLAVTTPR